MGGKENVTFGYRNQKMTQGSGVGLKIGLSLTQCKEKKVMISDPFCAISNRINCTHSIRGRSMINIDSSNVANIHFRFVLSGASSSVPPSSTMEYSVHTHAAHPVHVSSEVRFSLFLSRILVFATCSC